MNKLSEILQLAELFYKTAMQALALPEASTMPDDPEDEGADAPIVQRFANLVEETDNVDLHKKLKKYFDLYQSYVKALETGAKSEDDETFIDIGEALNNAWENVINDEYLNLEADDPDYTEDLPPHEIVNLIQELLASANEKKHAKGASLGISKEEMEAAEQAVQKDMNLPQGAKDVRIKLDDKQRKVYDEKVHKQLGYQKKFRAKLQTIKDLGVENLSQKRATLKQQMESATTPDQRKDLEMRFKNMPDPQLLLTHQAGRKKQYEAMMKDDKRRTKYQEEGAKRQRALRLIDGKRMEIIEALDRTQDPNSRKHLMNQLVKLEEKVLELKGKNLDDPFVRNDPKIMQQLDPTEIIRRHSGRRLAKQKQSALEYASLKERMLSGSFVGLLDTLLKKIVNYKASAKKAVVEAIIADVEKSREADLKPYKDAINLAVKNKDDAARLAAIKALNTAMDKKAINDKAELDPEIATIATRCDNFRGSVYELKRSSDEIQAGTASESSVIETISKLEGIIAEANGKRFTNAMVEHAASIITYLTQRK